MFGAINMTHTYIYESLFVILKIIHLVCSLFLLAMYLCKKIKFKYIYFSILMYVLEHNKGSICQLKISSRSVMICLYFCSLHLKCTYRSTPVFLGFVFNKSVCLQFKPNIKYR